jgi:hypothetical protein
MQLVRETARAIGRSELVVIGSQTIHATGEDVPADVVVSLECDVLFAEGDPAIAIVREQLGEDTPFHKREGVYVDAVPPGIPLLVEGWRDRLRELRVGDVVARCLEPHDLAVAKLAAGRLKDYELIAALIDRGIVRAETVEERIATFIEPRQRAVLRARLRIVMESLGR